jgi:hypothetical protein
MMGKKGRKTSYLKKLNKRFLESESISWVSSSAASMWYSHRPAASLVIAYGLCLPIKDGCPAKKSKHEQLLTLHEYHVSHNLLINAAGPV